MRVRPLLAVLAITAIGLLFLAWLGVRHYDGNVSGLLHMDVRFGQEHSVPEGLALYTDAGYDGMLYYQVARDLPALFTGGTTSLNSPYRFQRILLPLLTYAVTFGQEQAFPYALLAINIAFALGALALTLRITKKFSVHALTSVLNPAVLVGILFTLTEPASLFFVVLFLWAWERNGRRMDALCAASLFLSLLARETTVFLIAPLFVWCAWKRQWKDVLLTIAPMILLVGWQYFLVLRLGSVAFQANGNIVSFPFGGIVQLLRWLIADPNSHQLSSLALLAFLLPLCARLAGEWLRKKQRMDALGFLLSGLCAVMLIMDPHIWGVITSIGRVVTPIYPVYALYAAERDTWKERALSGILIAVSIVAAIGIASVPHPFVIS